MSQLLLQLERSGHPHTIALGNLTTLGRGADNDIVLDAREVSGRHAVVERHGDTWILRDLRSRNGTWLNGKRISEAVLQAGDRLQIATVKLQVVAQQPMGRKSVAVEVVGSVFGEQIRSVIQTLPKGGFKPASEFADMEHLKADYEKLRIAHELTLELGVERRPGELLGKALDYTSRVLTIDHGAALLEDVKTGSWKTIAVKNMEGQPVKVMLSRTVLRRVKEQGHALLVNDTSLDASLAQADSIQAGSLRSVLAAPLWVRDTVRGMLFFDNRSHATAFQQEDLDLVTGIAAQTSLALERSELLLENKHSAEKRAFLSRFLSPALVKDVEKGHLELAIEAQRRPLVVLFADMRGFTSFTERQGPERTVALLNELFRRLEKVIYDRGGMLDKFVGDALMATWGYPSWRPEHPFEAVRCAMQMQQQVADLSAYRQAEGKEPVGFGIALHYGEAVVGCIGSSRRMDFTANGDTVNTTARMSGLAGPGEVLVSSELSQLLEGRYALEPREPVMVKGRSKPATPCLVVPPEAPS